VHVCHWTGRHLVALETDEAIFKVVLSPLAAAEATQASPTKKHKAEASPESLEVLSQVVKRLPKKRSCE
jgi:hypothetical protein